MRVRRSTTAGTHSMYILKSMLKTQRESKVQHRVRTSIFGLLFFCEIFIICDRIIWHDGIELH